MPISRQHLGGCTFGIPDLSKTFENSRVTSFENPTVSVNVLLLVELAVILCMYIAYFDPSRAIIRKC